ncbi:DMT family transporter [Chelatococcus sp. GCM10030263]|uniref:DMT family transporter n=1 Tax=Chelatococcus sp. GCM10030263 TaxID=3273387 RepID=UPI00361831E5
MLLCTFLWGIAFVAQKSAVAFMEPLTFTGLRYLLGGLIILPLALVERRRKGATFTRAQGIFVLVMSVVFFFGVWLQQGGLVTTTVTNAGFLTSLYVLFAPVILIALRKPPHPIIWISMPLALAGVYFLNGGGLDSFNLGDALVVGSALFYAVHLLMLGHIVRATGTPIFISCISFLVAGVIASGASLALEQPTLAGISDGWLELAYAGGISTAIAYTLQAVGQQYVPPANAAVILSSESLFAGLSGALLLGERLPLIGYAGAGLIFLAVVLAEAVPALAQRQRAAVSA